MTKSVAKSSRVDIPASILRRYEKLGYFLAILDITARLCLLVGMFGCWNARDGHQMKIPGTRIIAISEKEDVPRSAFLWLWGGLAVPLVASVGGGSVVTAAY
jgi:hypothetical protein